MVSSLLTKGGLKPGTITNLGNNKKVNFMFNPFEYTISKSSTWNETTVTGRNVPLVSFQSGAAMTLSLKLYFDTQDTRTSSGTFTNVRNHTLNLWAMMMIDEDNVNSVSGKSEPPAVAFEWGELYFKAVITRLTEKISLFSETGTPLRSELDITLQQYFDPNDTPPQVPDQPTWTSTAPKTSTLKLGDRLDNIAASSGTTMRQLASSNNIDNPLRVTPGTRIST